MVRTLSAGAVGVHPRDLDHALTLAREFNFGGLEFDARAVAEMGASHARNAFLEAGVVPAVFGLPVEWRQDEERFRSDLAELPRLAEAAAAIGCYRTATWVLPGSDARDFDANWQFHLERFRPIAEVLASHDIALGLEFIGPKTLRDSFAHPFVHTASDMLRLGAEIGENVGLLLDCWHWYTSHGTLNDLRTLQPSQIVYVHLNDAPSGVDVDSQVDNVRCLPGDTGVIDLAGFLGTLKAIGYDGPAAVEPFNADLNGLPTDEAKLSRVSASLDKVFASAGLS